MSSSKQMFGPVLKYFIIELLNIFNIITEKCFIRNTSNKFTILACMW